MSMTVFFKEAGGRSLPYLCTACSRSIDGSCAESRTRSVKIFSNTYHTAKILFDQTLVDFVFFLRSLRFFLYFNNFWTQFLAEVGASWIHTNLINIFHSYNQIVTGKSSIVEVVRKKKIASGLGIELEARLYCNEFIERVEDCSTWKGFSPEWSLLCSVRWCLCLKAFSQTSHLYGLCPWTHSFYSPGPISPAVYRAGLNLPLPFTSALFHITSLIPVWCLLLLFPCSHLVSSHSTSAIFLFTRPPPFLQ